MWHWHIHMSIGAYIRCSSRTPCSVEYTQHIGPAPTRVTIAFTRRPTMAGLKCRKSQIGRPNMCASIRVTGDPKVGKLHCLRRRAIALPHSLRLRTPTGTVAAAVARWSKIDRVDDRHHYVCQHRRDQRPKVTRDPRSGTLSAVAAQMLSNTGFGCARPRAQSPHLGLTLPPRVGLMHLRHATRSGREIRGSDNRLRIAPRGCARYHESEDTCAPVRVAASRIDPPAKRWRTIDFHATGIEAEEFEGVPPPQWVLEQVRPSRMLQDQRRIHQLLMRSAPSTPRRDHHLRCVRCTCMRP